MTEKSALQFPISEAPDMGQPLAVADGVYWLRMPLPFSLNHINLWLLEDEAGWTIVDTGINTQTCKKLWQQVFDTHLKGKPVHQLIVTHLHPDHVGLAGWICETWGLTLQMSRTDYMACRVLMSDTGKPAPQAAIDFYKAAGVNDEQLESYKKKFGGYGKGIYAMPNSFMRLEDGGQVTMAGHTWEIIVGKGHAPEHLCLYCPVLNVFIAGDQLLPTISSNISVWPTEPYSDPLKEWLDSCAMLQQRIPGDVLVLPSHGQVFFGAHQRLQRLIDGHEKSLVKLLEACLVPQRNVDLFSHLFRRPITDDVLTLAVGETQAHINYLVAKNKLKISSNNGAIWYQTV
ncbi:MAG: MBL fold metallo-hydrolase [Gammaproteobacteria bacterium]|nr:MBL fold metallo-hydrolase [Gammaproteobacteria bacterium]